MNPELANVSSLSVKRVSTTPKTVAIQGHANSVSGYLYALTIVGIAAKPSAKILNVMATFPILVTNHKIRPIIDSTPHTKSNFVTFHSAFLFTNEAIKTVRGKKPVLKVIKDSNPTPCLICAANAISGAIAQSRKDTLFGLTFPFTVSIR